MERLACFVECAQVTGTDTHAPPIATGINNRYRLNIRIPDALGAAFGMAHIVSSRRLFASHLTFCHDDSYLRATPGLSISLKTV